MEENLRTLLELLQKNSEVLLTDIKKILNVSRPTIYTYIRELKQRGYVIEDNLRHNRTVYRLLNTSSTTLINSYTELTHDAVIKYEILKELSVTPMTEYELRERFETIDNCSYKTLNGNLINNLSCQAKKEIPIKRTTFDNYIKSLINENYINRKNKSLYPTGKGLPIIYRTDGSSLVGLKKIPENHPYYEQYKSIISKVSPLIEFDAPENKNDEISPDYVIVGKKYYETQKINESLKNLFNHPYKTKVLEFLYKTKKGECLAALSTGMLVYSLEKDELFLFGKYYPYNEHHPYCIIKINTIECIKQTDFNNECYLSNEFMDIFNSMFSISTEPPEEIVIEFDRIFHIENKIKQLSHNRSKSTLTFTDDKIIYVDVIRGLTDFARYLRSYGRSYKIIKPQRLKDILFTSAQFAIKRYNEGDN